MAEAFIFDYDGVMTPKVPNDPAQRLADSLDINYERVRASFGPLWAPYIRGVLPDDVFWHTVQADLQRDITPPQRDIWSNYEQLQPLEEMSLLVNDLQMAGYPVGLLSNAMPATAADLRSHGAYDPFDFAVVSCETKGWAKPDEQMYHLAMAHLPGVAMKDVVFVDDQPRCVEPAVALGLQGVVAENTEQIVADIRALAGL